MSGPAFTKGPWGWVIHDHSLASLGVLPDPGMGDPLVLATGPCEGCAGRADPKEWQWGRCQTPSEANARLIAAAPELYEALKAIVPSNLGKLPETAPDSCVLPLDVTFGEMRKVLAALAKASGLDRGSFHSVDQVADVIGDGL